MYMYFTLIFFFPRTNNSFPARGGVLGLGLCPGFHEVGPHEGLCCILDGEKPSMAL